MKAGLGGHASKVHMLIRKDRLFGFIRTGFDVTKSQCKANFEKGVYPRKRPERAALETSVPGVFAIGDVRTSTTKRVAAAVGEGAAVVSQIHAFLANLPAEKR